MTTRPNARIRSTLMVVTLAMGCGASPARAEDLRPEPELPRLRKHVFTLASPEFEGRRGAGARKAGDYVLDHFKSLKLEPLFGDEFSQVIP
ncbi:MAG: hypothetical protein AB7I30_17275, partial [Isosphaeraceae bacterium]